MESKHIMPCKVDVASETGRLRAVLLRRPGKEIERMTPQNAMHALYGDILNKPIVDAEYAFICGVLERWTNVYYVQDILEILLKDERIREHLVIESVQHENYHLGSAHALVKELMNLNDKQLSKALIEGLENPEWNGRNDNRYLLEPLYNLMFTRDPSSTVYNRVLINSMSFKVRERETLIYEAIFQHFFGANILNASKWNPHARTEGGDVQVASRDLLCIGQGIRTNVKGIEYLAQTFATEREHFSILVQELPQKPESFIHLDMVFTFLGSHQCMVFEPMLTKQDVFADKETTIITIDHGNISYKRVPNILVGLHRLGWDLEPVCCGGSDPWVQLREQWHSGANFFALGDGKIMGYRRNTHTIDALDKAGFAVLNAEDIVSNKVRMEDYEKFVVAFPGSELPRAGGGARCLTMPILRD